MLLVVAETAEDFLILSSLRAPAMADASCHARWFVSRPQVGCVPETTVSTFARDRYSRRMSVVTMIVAMAENRVIGRDGRHARHIPADLKRFNALTMGQADDHGRRTFDEPALLLPGRRHIVLTSDRDWEVDASRSCTASAALSEGGRAGSDGVSAARDFPHVHARRRRDRADADSQRSRATPTCRMDPRCGAKCRGSDRAEGEQPAYSYIRLIAD